MKCNSIQNFIDVQLFDKLCTFRRCSGDWMFLRGRGTDYGHWSTMSVDKLEKLMITSSDLRVMRTFALWAWKSEFHYQAFTANAMKLLAQQPKLDVFIEAFVFNDGTLPNEGLEVIEQSLEGLVRNSAMETLIAADALGRKASHNVLVQLYRNCAAQLAEVGINLEDDYAVLRRIIEIVDSDQLDNYPEIFTALKKLGTSAPRDGRGACGVCQKYGMSYRDCLMFSLMIQEAVNNKMINNPDQWKVLIENLPDVLAESTVVWSDVEKKAIKSIISSGDKVKMRIKCAENLYWLCTELKLDDWVYVNLLDPSWEEKLCKVDDSSFKRIVRYSMSRLNATGIREFFKRSRDVVILAFSEYEESSYDAFLQVVQTGVFNGIEHPEGLLRYFSKYYQAWQTKDSFDFLTSVVARFGTTTSILDDLLEFVGLIDFDYLSDEEKSSLFSITFENLIQRCPEKVMGFVKCNADCIPAAAQILKEVGDTNE